ncbi:MAG TPA: ABC transporter permease [Rhodanobacteraceae bacterium]|nr:ABC transporter permease [Rhodanobacteraceae bacterium]
MRTLVALARDNLRAHRGQAAYLILTLAITTTAWLTLAAVGAPYEGDAASTRITIGNGSQSGALPLYYARRIEAIRGAHDVFWYGMQVVHCAGAKIVPLNAFGGPGTDTPLTKHKVPAATIQHWNADPLAAVISDAAASKCGWRVGQGIEPPSGMEGHGRPIELHILGTFAGPFPVAYVHYDYINRAAPGMQGKDKVVTYFADAGDPRDDEALAARIEAAFAHDFPALKATTNTTVQNAWARFGKVQQLLAFVMAAVLLCVASVLVSVLAHATAQRRSRFAVLQVLGFRRSTLFSAFTLELLMTVVLGALLGIGLEKLLAHALGPTTLGFLSGGVHVPEWGWWGLPVWLAILTGAALAWPATLIARVRPADYRAI